MVSILELILAQQLILPSPSTVTIEDTRMATLAIHLYGHKTLPWCCDVEQIRVISR